MMPCQWLAALDVIWHIYLHLYCSLSMVVGTCHLQERQPLPQGRSPVSFGQISLGSVFQGKSWDKGPSSLALPRIVHHPWLAAPDVIWYIYSHLYCYSRYGGRDLPSSGEAAPTTGQVPCEFWVDQPGFSFSGEELRQGSFQPALLRMVHRPWPVALDVIWHIYLHLYCSLREDGRDLPSSGEAVPTTGQVPREFWVDQSGFSFSGEELRQGSFQPCPAQDGASSMAGGSRHLAHLLAPVLLLKGWW